EVLLGLGHDTVVGGDGEEDQVHAVRAGQHVADEALVSRHVDDPGARAVRAVEPGEPEVDRDAARLLLPQPVGVLSGEGEDERRLAVVDVPRGADDQRHGSPSAAPTSTIRSAGAKMPRRSRRNRRPWIRPRTGGRAERKRAAISSGDRAACSTASARLSSGATGSAPEPASASDATSVTTCPGP